jgi:hypothetical protein
LPLQIHRLELRLEYTFQSPHTTRVGVLNMKSLAHPMCNSDASCMLVEDKLVEVTYIVITWFV